MTKLATFPITTLGKRSSALQGTTILQMHDLATAKSQRPRPNYPATLIVLDIPVDDQTDTRTRR
jgi:hypothetical protein